MRRQNLDGSPAHTHFVTYDRYRRGMKSLAECAEFVDERDIAPAGEPPTCPECLNELAKTADDLFEVKP